MAKRYHKIDPVYFADDFITTTNEHPEVWAAASVVILQDERTEEQQKKDPVEATPEIYTSLDEWFKHCDQTSYSIHYFCNAKFDCSFILCYLLKNGYKNAVGKGKFDMEPGEVSYIISAKGLWYSVTFNKNGRIVEIRDSLKLIPASVEDIAEAFETRRKTMTTDGKEHKAGEPLSVHNADAIACNVLILAEAIQKMHQEQKFKLTIGACCLEEYKCFIGPNWDELFPNMGKITLDPSKFQADTADEYIRRAYRGGFCYIVDGKQGEHTGGCTVDVNGLHSYVMHSKSGNRYPVGAPVFWRGNVPDYVTNPKNQFYYFIRVKCAFKLKPGFLPWVQIKGSMFYDPHKYLENSMVMMYDARLKDNVYYPNRYHGQDLRPTLTFTGSDWELFKEHYEVTDLDVLDGCFFQTQIGLFDQYINKYAEKKATQRGALREISKMCLNSLPGKFATTSDASYKVASLDEKDQLQFETIVKRDFSRLVYIPIGAAVTSYAKAVTVRLAQKNFHGVDRPGFIYSDTDSLHLDISPDELIDIELDPKELGKWKLEAVWDKAAFLKQKTYMEHIVATTDGECDPRYSVKCAGLPKKCKENFTAELEQGNKTMTDFKPGLEIPGAMLPKYVPGGVILTEQTFKIS